ncbi:unnamed protein product [Lathyrus oleraceus]|uniref:Topless- protein 2 n=1 Tax=Pisum sativum TaxID=3888 RepID=A0A9D4X8V2_PEA|nr:topless-related protein 2-like [Pisum sativum]KAI5415699.1 Topless- protein 2 [Pisum sativum]
MSYLSRELVFLILQFLDEEKFKETVHKLEEESGYHFNMKYCEEKVLAGEWDEIEKYLSGFIKIDDNKNSMKTFFEIRKQKYLEALDRNDKMKAVDILVKDLKVFSQFNEDLFKELTHLLTLDNFRENEQLSKYGNTKAARNIMFLEIKKLIESNPVFRDKLVFPSMKSSRLRTLINHSLNWQHQTCKNPKPNPEVKTLFTDHSCSASNGARASTPVNLPAAAVARPSSFVPLGVHGGPFQPNPAAPNVNALAGWMMNPNPSSSIQPHALVASSMPGLPHQVSMFRNMRAPSNNLGMMEYDHEQLLKRMRSSMDEVTYPPPSQQQTSSLSLDELPRSVACTLYQGSTVKSMDFHPSLHSLLAVGCINGDMSLWEAGLRERLLSKPFKIKDIAACSVFFQAAIVKDSSISITRVLWSLDGKLLGVAFTKHLIQLYAYQGSNDLRQTLEIEAHVGAVNDLAFSYPNKQTCIVTCGDDKLVKVWDLNGRKILNYEGHEAPVYSVCPHQKENIQFIFSTSLDGKIKAWLYDNDGSRVDYDAPGQGCTTMLYSADGSRLFSCGTSKEGDSILVEWNESEGAVKRTYSGFRKKSNGVVQFDTAKNRFLATGEDSQIKFWEMDSIYVLTSIDAEGGLPSLPRLRFNKEGNLLAVSTADGGVKVLANTDGTRYLRSIDARSYEAPKPLVETKVANINQHINKTERVDRSSPAAPLPIINGVDSMARIIEKQRSLDDVADKSKTDLTEIVDPVHCRVVTLPDTTDPTNKVVCLHYTNSGCDIVALGANGTQKLWKWNRNEQNQSGKATASIVPQNWKPPSGALMTNDVPDNSEERIPCMAISKNDSYVMSACGGKISLFNLMTFRVMATFMSPPPSPTILVFHPEDNNIIAIGMEDATIHFYNVRVDEVTYKLKGHQKRITGLAFSTHLNILVSSSADAQLCFWRIDSWDNKKTLSLQLPAGRAPVGDTRVYFHSDQVHLLVCHESQLALYDASKMELTRLWVPQDGSSISISSATYSCNSQLIYAVFTDGNIGVFDADSLRPRWRITPSAYLHQPSSDSQNIYPTVITAHPQEPNQFAVGLSDGSVKVVEPNGRWGVSASVDNRLTSPSIPTNSTSEQQQR